MKVSSVLYNGYYVGTCPSWSSIQWPSEWLDCRQGKKCAMMICGVPYLIGYMFISYAHYTPSATAFKVVLCTGRFITGVGMGWASAVVPVSYFA